MKNTLKFIVVCFVLKLLSCSNKPKPEIYLIPSGFTGIVNIIYNQEKGLLEKYSDNKRVYQIPKDGILLTQFKAEFGKVERHFFYIDDNEKLVEIPIIHDYEIHDKSRKNKIGIYNQVSGVYGNRNMEYQGFEVCTIDGFANAKFYDSFRVEVNKKMNYNF